LRSFVNAAETSVLGPSSNEYQQLRQQISRLNRRVMHLEAESVQRQQRDVFLGILAVAYAVIKTINWLRN
jgi:TolA-binding protein